MFSEENIKRTKEKLAEYVGDNRYSFTRVCAGGKGKYNWNFDTEELSVKPIEDAMKVFGVAGTIDIIVEMLNIFYNDEKLEESVNIKTSDLIDFLDKYDYDEHNYYEDDYGYDDSEDDISLNQSTNKPKDKSELLTGLKDLDNQVRNLQAMEFLSYAWEDKDESEDSSEGLILSDVIDLDEIAFDKDAIVSTVRANVEFDNEDERELVKSPVSDKEMVNHPPHYNQGKFETIDIIEDIVRGYDDPVEAYLVGTTLKYLARAPFKGAKKQDLEKAEFYLKRAIDRQQ